jgi:hypothetical protein
VAGSVDIQFIDMSGFLQTNSDGAQRLFLLRPVTVMALLWPLVLGGCAEPTCPEPLSDVDGTCEKVDPQVTLDSGTPDPIVREKPEPDAERCDSVDNDGDTEIDEDWPELGEACGERAGVGACVAGEYVCADDGMGVVCEGAVTPSEEVCDGKDNDCDRLIDEGVLSVKGQVFGDHATVAAVDGGFVVTRVIADQVRVETYDTDGNRTGHHDDIDNPSQATVFLQSDSSRKRVMVALGQFSFYVLDVWVDSDLVPIILNTRELHDDWKQGTLLGVYNPPYHPRVLAAPFRFLGYRDLVTFALSSFAEGDLSGLEQEPTVAMEVPVFTAFDVAGPFVVWEDGENVRAGYLRNDGFVALDIDVGRGEAPGMAMGNAGTGLAYIYGESLRLSELGLWTLQCVDGGFCDEAFGAQDLSQTPAGPTALAFDDATDSWFVVAGTQIAIVGRDEDDAALKQAEVRDVLGDAPNRVEVKVSGGTAGVVQAAKGGKSSLTFLGCF